MASWVIYDNFKLNQLDADQVNFDVAGDTIKVALATSAYVPAIATDDFWNDVNANEVAGTNYTAGGIALANKTLTLAAGSVTFDNTVDPVWLQSATGFANARHAVLYKDTGVTTTSALIATADFGADVGNVAGDLTLQLDANGILTLS